MFSKVSMGLAFTANLSAATPLTFNRSSVGPSGAVGPSGKIGPSNLPFDIVKTPNGNDAVEDYQSDDGRYKFHAEIHYRQDDNKDGVTSEEYIQSHTSEITSEFKKLDEELNKMMESAFSGSIFGKNDPFGIPNLDRLFGKDDSESSGDAPTFFF
jgi:hypothetical protein